MKRGNAVVILFSLVVFACDSYAGETNDLRLDQVPKHILEAAKKATPTAVFSKADLETVPGGLKVYEIIGTAPEFVFETVPSTPGEIDIRALDDDGFGLQLIKVTLRNVSVEVDVLENGAIEEIERVIPTKLIPGMVMKRLDASYPGFLPTRIEASYNEHGKIFRYEFAGRFNGSALDLEISADGSKIVVADD